MEGAGTAHPPPQKKPASQRQQILEKRNTNHINASSYAQDLRKECIGKASRETLVEATVSATQRPWLCACSMADTARFPGSTIVLENLSHISEHVQMRKGPGYPRGQS
ncbi:MAG TPA: hypothetical protein VNG51_07015 [Ktedonobacteraceae bacterium]|nr:hypothetical protein [Ktedonobacteraceae bacterium]